MSVLIKRHYHVIEHFLKHCLDELHTGIVSLKIKGYTLGWFKWSIFLIIYFEIQISFLLKFLFFVVAMSDIVHDVEAIHGLR